MNRRSGLPALVLAAACWGSGAVAIKTAERGMGAMTLTLVEVGVAVAVLLVVLAARRAALPRPTVGLLALGLLEPGLAYPAYNLGLAATSAEHGALLLGTESVFVVILAALFLHERPTAGSLAGLGLAVLGVVLLTGGSGGGPTRTGDLLVLAGSALAGGYVVLAHRIAAEVDPVVMTTYQFAVGMLVTLPLTGWVLAAGRETWPAHLDGTVLAGAAVAGAVGSAGGFLLYGWALPRVSAGTAGISLTLIPVFGLTLSVLLLGDPLTARSVAAAAAIVLGLVLHHRPGGAPEPAAGDEPQPSPALAASVTAPCS